MAKVLSISEARVQINALSEHPEEVTVTKRGEPVLAILPYELYESILETLDIAADDEAMAELRQDIASLRTGKKVKSKPIEQVAKELGLELPG